MIVVVIAVLGGVYLAFGYVNPYSGQIALSELVLQLSGARGSLNMGFSMNELLELALRMAPDFLLEMFLGVRLYRHFCTAGVYVFSRYTKRMRWYFRELLTLGGQLLFYESALTGMVVIVSMCRHQIHFDMAGVVLAGYHIVLRCLWIFTMTLLINILAMFVGSDYAFVCVAGIQALGITLLGVAGVMIYAGDISGGVFWLQWNPLARLVLCWQSSSLYILHEVLKPPYPGLQMGMSMLVYGCICILVIAVGAVLVKRKELLNTTMEEGER